MTNNDPAKCGVISIQRISDNTFNPIMKKSKPFNYES